ncbi:hypothetical protein SSX86_022525 [Deinandra increscens subsp. villosa]|uniref:Replication protein A OB domain-containing protein n=1 Tax=Deinandra increscens subsp. villosa TaxID=3103831 RepID=A0AAP0GRF4_9ASTR
MSVQPRAAKRRRRLVGEPSASAQEAIPDPITIAEPSASMQPLSSVGHVIDQPSPPSLTTAAQAAVRGRLHRAHHGPAFQSPLSRGACPVPVESCAAKRQRRCVREPSASGQATPPRPITAFQPAPASVQAVSSDPETGQQSTPSPVTTAAQAAVRNRLRRRAKQPVLSSVVPCETGSYASSQNQLRQPALATEGTGSSSLTTPAQAAVRNRERRARREGVLPGVSSRARGRNRTALAALASARNYPYEDLGDCNCICEYCGATFWEHVWKVSEIAHIGSPKTVEGGAIQALFDDSHEAALDGLITLMACYRIQGYNCTRAPSMLRVARHPVAISMDKFTPIMPIPDTGDIPRFYFNFTPKKDLSNRVGKNDTLIDFIGRVERVTAAQTETRGVLTKIMLEDDCNEQIEVTLWEEIGRTVNVDALNATDHHVIAAITGLRVTRPLGPLQLQSTSATIVHIDPDIEEAKSMATRYCITGTISDGTGSVTATLFGNASLHWWGLAVMTWCMSTAIAMNPKCPTSFTPSKDLPESLCWKRASVIPVD